MVSLQCFFLGPFFGLDTFFFYLSPAPKHACLISPIPCQTDRREKQKFRTVVMIEEKNQTPCFIPESNFFFPRAKPETKPFTDSRLTTQIFEG